MNEATVNAEVGDQRERGREGERERDEEGQRGREREGGRERERDGCMPGAAGSGRSWMK